ncbi:MAG: hypothetical protein GXO27_05000 [Chlorobi bacterium]|nr:hypothetical protein [Chlorobiota bacterium]
MVRIESEGDILRIEIRPPKPRPWVHLLAAFAALSAAFPVFLFLGAVYYRAEISPFFVLTLILFWGMAWYVRRIYVWNTRGAEVWEISPDGLLQYFLWGSTRGPAWQSGPPLAPPRLKPASQGRFKVAWTTPQGEVATFLDMADEEARRVLRAYHEFHASLRSTKKPAARTGSQTRK